MSDVQLRTFLRQLGQAVQAAGLGRLGDAQLLQRFVTARDEAAFEVLVWRHGPAVLGVCRRVLAAEPDAEDAFQATFLTLARKAASVGKREALGSWLYKVAYRVAVRARSAAARRARAAPPPPCAAAGGDDPATAAAWREVRPVLDEEVSRLPDRYRAAFVLCHLEGKTNEEAARELGCPAGTVYSRLARARERLRGRLERRGLGLPACTLAAAAVPLAAQATEPLVGATVRAAAAFAVGQTSAVPERAAVLTKGVLQAMLLSRLRIGAALVILAAVAAGVGAWSYPALRPAPEGDGPARGQAGAARADQASLQGTWVEIEPPADGEPGGPGDTGSPAGGPDSAGAPPRPAVRWVFEDDVLHVKVGKNIRATGSYRLNAAAKPRAIDFHYETPGKDGVSPAAGIYTLDGDRLTIFFGPLGKPRPKAFEKPAPGPKWDVAGRVHVLRREEGSGDAGGPAAPPAPIPPDDAKDIQGAWKLVNGLPGQREKWVFDEGSLVYHRGVKDPLKHYFKLNPAAKPKTLDITTMVQNDGPVAFIQEGIYELKGDDLKICLTVPGRNRPTEFPRDAGPFQVLQFKRDVADVAAAEPRTDRDRLQGTWAVTAGEQGGKALPDEIKENRLVFRGDTLTYMHPKMDRREERTFRLYPGSSPKAIDVTGPKGKQFGIYQQAGEELKLCLSPDIRPANFVTREDSNALLLTLRRDPKAEPFPEEFVRAEVTIHPGEQDGLKAAPDKATVTDAARVAKLAAFFSDAGRGKQSPLAANWKPKLSFRFERSAGPAVVVHVHRNWETWTEGAGDWKAKPGLQQHVAGLLADAERKKLQGAWKLTAVERDGQRRSGKEIKNPRWVIRGNVLSYQDAEDRIIEKHFRLDPTRQPKAIWLDGPPPSGGDAAGGGGTAGPGEGGSPDGSGVPGTAGGLAGGPSAPPGAGYPGGSPGPAGAAGIYRLDGDVLTICVSVSPFGPGGYGRGEAGMASPGGLGGPGGFPGGVGPRGGEAPTPGGPTGGAGSPDGGPGAGGVFADAPEDFAAGANSGRALFVLKRE